MRKRTPKHQGSRRVGPAAPIANRRGFLHPLLWPLIGIAYMTAAFWAWVVMNAPRAVDERWF